MTDANAFKAETEVATLGGGCFWCLEAVYDDLQGVSAVESGYCNGPVINPTYRQVCEGDTGHAEVVRVSFDPAVISFREILEVFFVIHDPTTLDRQGNDAGTQYRSGIYCHSDAQKTVAAEMIAELTRITTRNILPTIARSPIASMWLHRSLPNSARNSPRGLSVEAFCPFFHAK
jgi:peptide-methionine (S)-S-oxide reductase